MNVETELKLSLPPRLAARVMAHPVIEPLATGAASLQRLLTIYYDTPNFELWSAQVSVRLRRTPAGWIQTVKWGGSAAGGLHRREELEFAVPDQTVDFDAIVEKVPLTQLAAAGFRRRIKPVFVTEFQRATRMLRLASGSIVEFSLDRGHIVAGTARLPLCELELELKGGDALGLFDLARELLAHISVRPLYRSKAERGYLLAGLEAGPVKAPRVALDESVNIAQSAAHIIASGLEQIQANEDGMLVGEDVEYLHQMRVGVRRLRSCFSIYSHVVPEGEIDAIMAELRWFGRQLGPARDWDVFSTEILPQLSSGLRDVADPSALEALSGSVGTLRERAQRSARSAVHSRRGARLVLELGRIVAGGGLLPDVESMQAPAKTFVSGLLDRRLRRVLTHVSRRKPQSVAELHALRIAVKKLRYAVEFFGALYDADRVGPFRDRLTRLQDCLGAINDAASMLGHVRAALSPEGRLVECVGGWSAHVIHEEKMRFRGLWRQFRRSRPFW